MIQLFAHHTPVHTLSTKLTVICIAVSVLAMSIVAYRYSRKKNSGE
ncbi:MAG: hypothetical protein U0520_02095 [Candidatus Saccharimonadales bacterium]